MMQTMIDKDGNEFVAIHLSVKGFQKWTGKPMELIACMPDATELHSTPARGFPYCRSCEPMEVTCPLCKQTDFFAESMRQYRAAKSKGQRIAT